jgi:hypothetical protein
MAVWLPDTRRNLGNDAGSFIGPVTIGVIHTTESSTFTPGDTYFGRNVWPHFTFIQGDRSYTDAVWQHLPLDRAARALANRSGGVETNREGCIQIEVVGYASRPAWSQGGGQTVWNFRRLMRAIEANTDIPRRCGVTFGGNEQYGLDNRYELSNSAWESYRGWLGHQHVPENSHWDPGEIDIDNLLALEDDMPTVDEIVQALADPDGPFMTRVATHTKNRVLEALANAESEQATLARQQIAKEVLRRERANLNLEGHDAESVNLFTGVFRAAQHAHGAHMATGEVLAFLQAQFPPAEPEPTPEPM